MTAKEIFKLFKDAISGKETDYTSGNINKALILLSIPMMLEMVMESLFAIVDIYFVAKVSNNAIATIGNTEGVLMLIESIGLGIAMGVTALISRRIGEKEDKKASHAAIQALILATIFSLITGILAFFFADEILSLLTSGNESVVEEGQSYTRIILSMNFIIMYLFVFNGIYRAAGNPAIAMRTLFLSNGINIVLHPILIFGIGSFSGMGVTGAAIATCIGRGTGVIYQVYIMLSRGSIIRIYKQHLKPNLKIIKDLFRLSLGAAGQFLISTASWLFLIYILNRFGEAKFSGYTIALRVVIFTILPSWGLAMAAATLVGQNLGAGKAERAEQTVWKTCKFNVLYLLIISIIFFVLARPIIGFFSQDLNVINEGVLCLKILCVGYIFFAYEMVILQAFNGAGDTITPTKKNLCKRWLFQIPFAFILSNTFLGSMGVYAAISLTSVLASIVSIYIFKKGKWKQTVV